MIVLLYPGQLAIFEKDPLPNHALGYLIQSPVTFVNCFQSPRANVWSVPKLLRPNIAQESIKFHLIRCSYFQESADGRRRKYY